MTIEVTARHLHVKEEMQTYAKQRVEKVIAQFPKVESIHVILDKQRHLFSAEVIVQKKGETLVGESNHAVNLRSAIDTSAARAEKQLRDHRKKTKTKIIRHAERAE